MDGKAHVPTLTTGSDKTSVEDIARELKKSTHAVYRHIRNGTIPPGVAIKIGRSVYISRRRFAEWLEAGGTLSKVA